MSFIFNKGIFNSYNVKKKMAESPLQYLKFKKSDERICKGVCGTGVDNVQ